MDKQSFRSIRLSLLFWLTAASTQEVSNLSVNLKKLVARFKVK